MTQTASSTSPTFARLFLALGAVAVLCVVALAGAHVSALGMLLTVVLPYAAAGFFLVGVVLRVVRWARAPVPFRIPTTCGQQRSLPWIASQSLDNPSTTLGVIGRMLLEVFAFRSLLRNTRSRLGPNRRLLHVEYLGLWLAALVFHGSLLVVLVRHLRLLLEPVPAVVVLVQQVDGFLQIGLPVLFMSTAGFTVGLLYLTYRRLADPGVRYLSLAADYFPLFLLLGIASTGILMRHFVKTDVVGIKALMVGLATFHPEAPAAPAPLFLMHLTMVSALLAYFPASKLMHMAGVFMSPTRNLANSNRWELHVNPWNPEVKTHSYAEWEEEFREKLQGAGVPLDSAPAAPSASPGSK